MSSLAQVFEVLNLMRGEGVVDAYAVGGATAVLFSGQVRLDPEVHTLVWPNGADFDSQLSMTGHSCGRAHRSSPRWASTPALS